jgi:DNA-binding winged helix-turn-helix (wHTH) protein
MQTSPHECTKLVWTDLVMHAGLVVTKEALLEAVWPETMVTEEVLKTCLGQIRHALGEQAKTPRYIATVHRRGYRFIASVTVAERFQVAHIARSPKASAFDEQPRYSYPTLLD